MPATFPVRAAVEPHDHQYSSGGPVDFLVQVSAVPLLFRTWDGQCRIRLEQPDPDSSNLTLLHIAFNTSEGLEKWYNCKVGKIHKEGAFDLCIKARIIRTVPLPLPLGMWEGHGKSTTKRWNITLQAKTLLVQKETPRIIVP